MDSGPPIGVVSERQVRCALDVTAATWLVEAKDLEGARRVLTSALALVPHDVPARTMLALVLFRMRDFIAASELYERLLAEFRGDLALTFNLALCHMKSGRPDAAAAGLRHILDLRPDHARARVWLRVAEAATVAQFTPGGVSARTAVRANRLDELPRVTLPPGTAVAKDATGVVSVRVHGGTRWLARPDALQGYTGDVVLETRAGDGDRVVSLSGTGTAFLRAKEALVVIDLHDEETCVRATALVAYASTLRSEAADPEIVGEFDEDILRFTGAGAIVLEARAELVALPVSLTHATTVRWDNVIGWTGNVIGAPSDSAGADGRALARFAGNGALLLAMHDEGTMTPVIQSQEWYGRYQVLRRIEENAMEEVLLARSHGPGGFQRKVILKRHLQRHDGDSHFLQILAREAHAYALLTHPGIVRLYDFLLLDGHPVLVLEYVSGVSLSTLETALLDRNRIIDDQFALYVAHGVFSALAAAHVARDPDTGEFAPVMHRDLRPGNVMLGWNGDVKLTSFVTMMAAGSSGPRSERDAAGYLAPEQLRGAPFTVSTDVYVASLLLYEMLTHGRAFDPTLSDEELKRAMAEPRLDDLDAVCPDLDRRLRDAIRIALAPDAESRSVSAADMARAIEAAVDLRVARQHCVDELASLRESAFGSISKSSRPPPPSADAGDLDDSGFFRGLGLPKPSPLPQITPAAWPPIAASAANNTIADTDESARPTPIPPSMERSFAAGARFSLDALSRTQPSSLGPSAASVPAPRAAGSRRRTGTGAAIGLTAVALAAGVAAVIWSPGASNGGSAAANRAPEATDDSAQVVPGTVTHVTTVPFPPASSEATVGVVAVGASASAPLDSVSAPTVVRPEGSAPTVVRPEGSAPTVVRLPAAEPSAVAPVASADAARATALGGEASGAETPAEGLLHTPPRAAQHRIYLDGRVIGEGEGDYRVGCGTHSVRIGSKGDDVSVEIPCGGSVSVD